MHYETGGPRFRPDIVIAQSTHVSAILEIKFVPHWNPNPWPDVEKLQAIAKEGEGKKHALRMDPLTGYTGDKALHEITHETQYGLMIVGNGNSRVVVTRDSLEPYLGPIRSRFHLFYGRITERKEEAFGVE